MLNTMPSSSSLVFDSQSPVSAFKPMPRSTEISTINALPLNCKDDDNGTSEDGRLEPLMRDSSDSDSSSQDKNLSSKVAIVQLEKSDDNGTSEEVRSEPLMKTSSDVAIVQLEKSYSNMNLTASENPDLPVSETKSNNVGSDSVCDNVPISIVNFSVSVFLPTGSESKGKQVVSSLVTGSESKGKQVVSSLATGSVSKGKQVVSSLATGSESKGKQVVSSLATGSVSKGKQVISSLATGSVSKGKQVVSSLATGSESKGKQVVSPSATNSRPRPPQNYQPNHHPPQYLPHQRKSGFNVKGGGGGRGFRNQNNYNRGQWQGGFNNCNPHPGYNSRMVNSQLQQYRHFNGPAMPPPSVPWNPNPDPTEFSAPPPSVPWNPNPGPSEFSAPPPRLPWNPNRMVNPQLQQYEYYNNPARFSAPPPSMPWDPNRMANPQFQQYEYYNGPTGFPAPPPSMPWNPNQMANPQLQQYGYFNGPAEFPAPPPSIPRNPNWMANPQLQQYEYYNGPARFSAPPPMPDLYPRSNVGIPTQPPPLHAAGYMHQFGYYGDRNFSEASASSPCAPMQFQAPMWNAEEMRGEPLDSQFQPPNQFPSFSHQHQPQKDQLNEAHRRSMIVRHIEYYFSIENLVDDVYLRSRMDEQGWVPVSVIASFPKMRRWANGNAALILEAMQTSTAVEVEGDKLRRRGDWYNWIYPHESENVRNSAPTDTN